MLGCNCCTFVIKYSIDMVERIKELLQADQLTPTQFADRIGVARPIISHILSGRNKPSLEVVQKILAAFPQLSLDWLLKGAGSMLAGATPPATSTTTIAQSAVPADAPVNAPIEAPVDTPPSPAHTHKAAKAPRYKPQHAPSVMVNHPEAERATAAPLGYASSAHMPRILDVATTAAVPTGATSMPASPPAVPPGFAAADAQESVRQQPDILLSQPTETTVAKTNGAASAQSIDKSLAGALAEPGKLIRRIVIFYQDGTFTDYQPEPRG
ncbi:helix-turn-helix domain-containing protein [Hymenobacter puniceus]|uniref:helix-turn-helix domain-containing protein n=1 Tax=Hymenobacter sp. BT190 TaxID=2763505 RepID=UPI0016511AE6|nr:helix-turn-helix transcriptional regulator [Hymenobacter sp. BT190]MBC6698669.1 helix-turn-helix domain-containing protein [Hymenobacter sp. BT190]